MVDLEIPNYLNLSDHEKTETLLDMLSSFAMDDVIFIDYDLLKNILADNDVDRMHMLLYANVELPDGPNYELYDHCYYRNCQHSSCHVIEFLINMHADPNHQGHYRHEVIDNTPLAASIINLNKCHVQKLLDAKADINNMSITLNHERFQLLHEFAHYF